MWRFALALGAFVALLPTAALAAPDDRGPAGLSVSPAVVIARQAQELSVLQGELTAVTADRDAQAQKVAQLQDQVSALQGQLAAANAGVGAAAPSPPRLVSAPAGQAGSTAGRFAFGQCTYYVALRRYIPWMGNANQWPAAAAAMGYAEGSVPRAGAIMVSADSIWGHVSYVESVGGGGWTVSEMNYTGWDLVDYRAVTYATARLIAFIY